MKTLIAVSLLLALASPAFAARTLQNLDERCRYIGWTDDENEKSIAKACAAHAERPVTATPAQWKDIHELYYAFAKCGGSDDPELKQACDRSDKLFRKLQKQGFCFYKRLIVGKLAWHGPEEDRAKLWPEGEKQCYTLHDPAR